MATQDNKTTADKATTSAVPADQQATPQVKDTGTEHVSGDEIANAAAETLHGDRAQPEHYEQSDATVLPGGSTFVADEPQSGDRTGK